MKIKLFFLMLAVAMSNVMFAGNAPVFTDLPSDPADIVVTIDLDQIDFDEDVLTDFFADLGRLTDDNLTCEVTFKVKIGYGGSGIEAGITVKGDCDEVVEEAKKQIAAIKELAGQK